jgi:hypothetical protein
MGDADRGDSLTEAGKLRAELAGVEGRLREAEAAYQERERLKRVLDSPEDFPDVDLDEIKQKFAEAHEPGRRASLTRLRLRQRQRALERDLFDYRFEPDTYEEDEEEYDAANLWDDDDSERDEADEDVRFELEEAASALHWARVSLRRYEEELAGRRETIARYKALLSDKTQVERLARSPDEWPSLGLDVDEETADSPYARTLAALQAALAGQGAAEDVVTELITRYKRETLRREAKTDRLRKELAAHRERAARDDRRKRPALYEVERRGWQLVWSEHDFGGGPVYRFAVQDNQGVTLAQGTQVHEGSRRVGEHESWDVWKDSYGTIVDMDAEAEQVCAMAIRAEQARRDRWDKWRSRSRQSRAWAALRGKGPP